MDNVMKEKTKTQIGEPKKQALVITEEEDELMWSERILGADTPELLNSLVYLV